MQIRWRDMDAYGHVNNAVYLSYLEHVRDKLLEQTLGAVADTNHFVLAHVGIDFRSELTLDDEEIVVRAWVDSIGRSSVRTREEVRKLDGTLSAESEAVVVPRDPEKGGSRPLTHEEREALEEALEAENSEGA
jgi:acyl-CoA thioester hydrolase